MLNFPPKAYSSLESLVRSSRVSIESGDNLRASKKVCLPNIYLMKSTIRLYGITLKLFLYVSRLLDDPNVRERESTMPKSGKKTAEQAKTAGFINRQIRRPENAQFLCRVPGFEIPSDMPSQLKNLLSRLNEAEGQAKAS